MKAKRKPPKLKGCPWCRVKPKHESDCDDWSDTMLHHYKCFNKHCVSFMLVSTRWFKSKKEARDAWNTREA